jgi:hypothetical protein
MKKHFLTIILSLFTYTLFAQIKEVLSAKELLKFVENKGNGFKEI